MESKKKSKWWIWLIVIIACISIIGSKNDDDDSSREYKANDKYYSKNDHDNDGKLSGKEFQDSVGDWLSDHGY